MGLWEKGMRQGTGKEGKGEGKGGEEKVLGQLSLASLWGRLIEYQLRLGQGQECHLCRVAGNTA